MDWKLRFSRRSCRQLRLLAYLRLSQSVRFRIRREIRPRRFPVQREPRQSRFPMQMAAHQNRFPVQRGDHPFRFPVRQAALPLLLPGPGRLCRSMTPGLRRPGSLGQTRRLPLPGPETAARGLEQLRRPARLSRKRILPFPALRSWKTRRSSDTSRKQRM